jgi:hypothetical protein
LARATARKAFRSLRSIFIVRKSAQPVRILPNYRAATQRLALHRHHGCPCVYDARELLRKQLKQGPKPESSIMTAAEVAEIPEHRDRRIR